MVARLDIFICSVMPSFGYSHMPAFRPSVLCLTTTGATAHPRGRGLLNPCHKQGQMKNHVAY